MEVSLSGSDGQARLSVRDHGPGIPPEERQTILRLFQPGRRSHRGLGVGLYLSREIARLHGGEIRLECPPDGGACFIVELPLAK